MANVNMTPVGAGELAQLQADLNAAMDERIAIWRRATGQGQTGNTTATYALNATVNGTLAQPTGGMLQNYAYLIGDLSAWAVRLPVGTSVQATDHLVVGGQTLEVQIVLQPQSYQGVIRVLATEIR